MADQIRAAVAVARPTIEGHETASSLHKLIARFAQAQLYRQAPRIIERLRRELVHAVAREFYPYARAVGKASAEPLLNALGGTKLVDKGNVLRGRILAAQRRFQKGNMLTFRAELRKELGTLGGDVEAAFARAFRDGKSRQQLIADLVQSDHDELVQLAKARKRVEAGQKGVASAERRLARSGKRSIRKNRRLLREAADELKKAKRSVRAGKSFYARFETRVQGHVRDGIRREVQESQFSAYRAAGIATFTWVAVNGSDACPSCQGLHGTTKPAGEWRGQGPGEADTFCGTACQCHLAPAGYVAGNASLVGPVNPNV